MQVEYPLSWVFEIAEEMGFVLAAQVGESLSFKRPGNPRRLLIPALPEVPDYILSDNAEYAGVLEEYQRARDRVIGRHAF